MMNSTKYKLFKTCKCTVHVANQVNYNCQPSRGWQIYVSSYFSLEAASRTQWQCLGDLDYGLVKV